MKKLCSIRIIFICLLLFYSNFIKAQWVKDSLVTDNDVNTLDFWDANNGCVVGDALLFTTTTGGNPWVVRDTGGGWIYNQRFAVQYLSSNKIVAAGWEIFSLESKIFLSNDGGGSWNIVYSGPDFEKVTGIHFPTSTLGFAITDDGYIKKSTNGGGNYYPIAVYKSDTNAYCLGDTAHFKNYSNPALTFQWWVNGKLYVSGSLDGGKISIDTFTIESTSPERDGFIAAFDTTDFKCHFLVKTIGNNNVRTYSRPLLCTYDPEGNTYVASSWTRFGNYLSNYEYPFNPAFVLEKYDMNGNRLWSIYNPHKLEIRNISFNNNKLMLFGTFGDKSNSTWPDCNIKYNNYYDWCKDNFIG